MKRLTWIIVSFVALASLVLLALPTFLGSRWVYQPLVDRLADERFALTIKDVKLRWFQPIAFGQIELAAHTGSDVDSAASTPLVKIEAIRSDRSLLGFLLNGRNLGTIEIINPNVDVRLLEDTSNLERLVQGITQSNQKTKDAEDADDSKKKNKTPPLLDINIVVKGFHVTVIDEQSEQPIMVIPPFDTAVSYKSVGVEPQVVVAPTKALDQVVITRQLVRLGLAKAVPLLANSTEFDGKVSLESGPVTIPLGHPQDTTASATLTLHSVRTVPTDPAIIGSINFLGRLFRRDLPHELVFIDGSQINVQVANQVVKHDGVRAGLPEVDDRLQIASAGSVGLVDRKLDIGIEIPVPLEQLARNQAVKQLGVPSITLPISGTLDKPELDWDLFRKDSANLLSAMSGVLSEEAPLAGTVIGGLSELAEGDADKAIENGVDLVKQILEKRQQRKQLEQEQQGPGAKQPDKSEAEPSGRPVRDAFKNIFRGK
jgi:hypothetical protein